MRSSRAVPFGRRARSSFLLVAALGVPLVAGCPAVYPELGTRTRKIVDGQALDPPPPDDLRFLKFVSGRVPPRTRDGRSWGGAAGSMPDPYAKLILNGKELLRTSSQSDTLEPTWPGAPGGNFRIVPGDKIRVELWDSNSINDQPIGVRDVGHPTEDHRLSRQIRVELEGGGELVLAFEPAHAVYGLGLWFELRTTSCFITRMMAGSPAERAGVKGGDEVLQIAGREVKAMSSDEVRSAFNSVPTSGMPLLLRHADGATLNITLKEGPIYPKFGEAGTPE
jgi:hypothetical protein